MTIGAGAGDPVGGVPDLSGNGFHAQQGTLAMKPTLAAAAFPSGRAGLSFDGVDDRLIVVDLGAAFSGSDKPFTVGMAVKVTDASHRAMQGLGSSASTTPYSMLRSDGTYALHYRRDDASSGKTLYGPAIALNSPVVVTATFGETPGVVGRIALNGSGETSGDLDVGTMTVDRFCIGAVERSGSALYPWKGLIGAWLVCDAALGADDRARLARYLMGWAGI